MVFTVPESEVRLELVVARFVFVVLREPERVDTFVFVVERFELVVARFHERVFTFVLVVLRLPERVAIDPVIVERDHERAFCARRSV